MFIALSELSQPDRESLHETAALVVAHWSAQHGAEERQEDQSGQVERQRSHAGGEDAAGLIDEEVSWLLRGKILVRSF